ncbi:hypothetical protein KM803_09205 [Clostridium tyrobutyricum]|uniref:hypothetical protein n=1 Tax=Clostridium tyrobutyricum TaxID=1519 RepID=UPI001C391299|nr:hypothetical protein [Clostridium tyrobutyricum]MBV4431512.1 hypothetical protein [Clostridium tyrobutyricum]MBV4436716.1 hypothetical protein [Clostridium tyrobutyricum]
MSWSKEALNSKEFKTGLKKASEFDLTMAKVSLGIELKRGEKVKSKIAAVEKEIERRKKGARGNDSRGQRRIG